MGGGRGRAPGWGRGGVKRATKGGGDGGGGGHGGCLSALLPGHGRALPAYSRKKMEQLGCRRRLPSHAQTVAIPVEKEARRGRQAGSFAAPSWSNRAVRLNRFRLSCAAGFIYSCVKISGSYLFWRTVVRSVLGGAIRCGDFAGIIRSVNYSIRQTGLFGVFLALVLLWISGGGAGAGGREEAECPREIEWRSHVDHGRTGVPADHVFLRECA